MELFQFSFMTSNEIVERLRRENAKDIARKTGIPYDRMAKWLQGKGNPKQDDHSILENFFNGINSTERKTLPLHEDVGSIGIPLVSVEAIAGFNSVEFSIAKDDVQARYVVPDFKDVDFMIPLRGSSMYPKYSAGDIVACRIIRESSFIQWNKTYIVATKEQGILCKRLRKSEKQGCYLAVSDNKEYDPFDLPIKEIIGIALIVGVIRLE